MKEPKTFLRNKRRWYKCICGSDDIVLEITGGTPDNPKFTPTCTKCGVKPPNYKNICAHLMYHRNAWNTYIKSLYQCGVKFVDDEILPIPGCQCNDYGFCDSVCEFVKDCPRYDNLKVTR